MKIYEHLVEKGTSRLYQQGSGKFSADQRSVSTCSSKPKSIWTSLVI